MSASTDVPVTITPEADARVAELGMHKELEQRIAHVREVAPGLAAIGVEIAECYDSRDETGVSIVAYSDELFGAGKSAAEEIDHWVVHTFPPHVLEHLCILYSPERPHAR